jgi:hypothetical protein
MQTKYLIPLCVSALVIAGCDSPEGTAVTMGLEIPALAVGEATAAAPSANQSGDREGLTEREPRPGAQPVGDDGQGAPSGGSGADDDFGLPGELPLPSSMSTQEFEARLFPFLKSRRYVELGWRRDKSVRDTGPYLKGVYYGTHPAVRVYYSPGIMRWLVGGRHGEIPDGEMIIKEQFAPPAARHHDKNEQQLHDALRSWTVMIKDAQGSHDGWFWSNPGASAEVIDHRAVRAIDRAEPTLAEQPTDPEPPVEQPPRQDPVSYKHIPAPQTPERRRWRGVGGKKKM